MRTLVASDPEDRQRLSAATPTRRWVIAAIAVWALGALLLTWRQVDQFVAREHARQRAGFDQAWVIVVQRLDQNEALLDGLVALLRSSRDRAFPELRRYADEMLARYPHRRRLARRHQATSPEPPAVGTVTDFWDFTLASTGFASPLSDVSTTVKSVAAAAGSYSRERLSDGRIDGFAINQPRTGLRYRAAGSSPTNSGGTVTFSEFLAMPLADTGVTFYASVAATENFFGISVGKP